MSAILAALTAILKLLPEIAPAAVRTVTEVLDSKKALATVGTMYAVHASAGDWRAQAVSGALGLGYTVAQGLVDVAKAKAGAGK